MVGRIVRSGKHRVDGRTALCGALQARLITQRNAWENRWDRECRDRCGGDYAARRVP
jgi:hypothetical protein